MGRREYAQRLLQCLQCSETQEEIVLLFGMNQAWHSGQKEVTIQLADRIVLSPFVIKRLATLLGTSSAITKPSSAPWKHSRGGKSPLMQ